MAASYYLGADIGGTKTRVLIADESGRAVGFGLAGPGNHETVGYDGLSHALKTAFEQARRNIPGNLKIAGAGFGVAGYDWPSQRADTLKATRGVLGLDAPCEIVNDTILGLLAGADEGWGIVVVSGTGCNCWGRDPQRQRYGRMTGGGTRMGEGAGASELMHKAVKAVAHSWTRRGPATSLTQAFVQYAGAAHPTDLMEGLMLGRYVLGGAAAPLVFQAAEAGDRVAGELIHWAGCELGEMINAVGRQLGFQDIPFDLVLMGSMFNGGARLLDPMHELVAGQFPHVKPKRLSTPPVVGAVLLGMEQARQEASGPEPAPQWPASLVGQNLIETVQAFIPSPKENGK